MKKRINLEFSESARLRLEALQNKADAATMTDVIKRALHLYDLVLTNQLAGGTVVLRTEQGDERQVLLV